MKKILKTTFLYKVYLYFKSGRQLYTHVEYLRTKKMVEEEKLKRPFRFELINYLLSSVEHSLYLEIGVRNPNDNFYLINADTKYSVDPGVEFKANPVDFQMTSDEFFRKLDQGEILNQQIRFDVIFIDGLHLAEQVDRDIRHAFKFLKEDGFIVLHDCNPATEWHSRECHNYHLTPARYLWNGTTWKAFMKWRANPEVNSCCINSDWGLGILSKIHPIGKSINPANFFFEFTNFNENRKPYLNLMEFSDLKELLEKNKI